MVKAELENLSKDELIELVLDVYAMNENLFEENGQLRERVSKLEEQLERPPKTPENSSVLPSAGHKANRHRSSRQRKRGAQKGHKGTSRRRSKPDVTLECRMETCPDCGNDLASIDQHLIGSPQVVEVPPVDPVVVEAHRIGAAVRGVELRSKQTARQRWSRNACLDAALRPWSPICTKCII